MGLLKLVLIVVPVVLFFIIAEGWDSNFRIHRIFFGVVMLGCIALYLEILKNELIDGIAKRRKSLEIADDKKETKEQS